MGRVAASALALCAALGALGLGGAGTAGATPTDESWLQGPTGMDTAAGTLDHFAGEIDDGASHVVTSRPGESVTYGSCRLRCHQPMSWQPVELPGTASSETYDIGLKVDSGGRPWLSWYDSDRKAVRVAACQADCFLAANWTVTTVATVDSEDVFTQLPNNAGVSIKVDVDLALDAGDRPAVVYTRGSYPTNETVYARCTSECDSAAAWTHTVVTELNEGQLSGLELEFVSGSPVLIHIPADKRGIGIKTCDSGCAERNSWRSSRLAIHLTVIKLSVDWSGARPAILFAVQEDAHASRGSLAYVSCISDCANGQTGYSSPLLLTDVGFAGAEPGSAYWPESVSLELLGGQPRFSAVLCRACVSAERERRLLYGACEQDCASRSNWSIREFPNAAGSDVVATELMSLSPRLDILYSRRLDHRLASLYLATCATEEAASGQTDADAFYGECVQDTSAPETQIESGPASGVKTTQRDVSFAFSASEEGSTFECRLDGAAWGPCESPRSYAGLSDGSHVFAVRATDPAGNTDQTPATRSWTVDTGAPETLVDAGPAEGSRSSAPDASFRFSASEEGSTFECRLDGAAWGPCESPRSYAGLSDGSHVFAVRATDPAGNTDQTPATRTWAIDTVAPETAIDSGPPDGADISSAMAAFTFYASEAGSTFECRLDEASWERCDPSTSYAGLKEGHHTLAVRAVDAAGNVDQTPTSRRWVVDTVPPDTAIETGPAENSSTTGNGARFTFSGSEAPAEFECRLDSNDWEPCASPTSYSALGAGRHDFAVRARDRAGNLDPTPAVRSWAVDSPAPGGSLFSTPPAPAAPRSFAPIGAQVRAAPVGVVIGRTSFALQGRSARLQLSCSGGSPCRGAVRLFAMTTGKRKYRSARPGSEAPSSLVLSRAPFDLRPGASQSVRLRIRSARLKRVCRFGRYALFAELRPGSGGAIPLSGPGVRHRVLCHEPPRRARGSARRAT